MIKDNIISRYTAGFLLPMLLVLFMTSPAMAVSTLAVFSGGPPPAINCPADITQDNDPGTCWAVVTYTPPANATLISGMPSGSAFPVGTTTNIFKANGDTATCSFTVTVVDTEPPIMTCPGNISKSYDAGLCQAVYYTTPVAIDNCPSVMVYQLTGLPSGSVFPAGQTTNTFQAVDAAGNTATCSFTITIGSGHVTVLPGDGSVSGDLAPQGAVRYQRQLLLVTPSEAGVSGLTNGMIVNSAGFTFASAQNDTVQGRFKLYLQNTPDTESRMDTVWTTATSTSPSYNATGLAPGIYEWQVSAVCPGSPGYSDPVVFENDNLSGCNQPYNLSTDPVTYNSATFHWECAGSPGFNNYELRYHRGSAEPWQNITTTDTFYVATGLAEDTLYQWEVRTICTGDDSPLSAASFQTGTQDQCSEPSALTVVSVGDTSVNLSWSAVSGVNYYQVQYRRSGTAYWYDAVSPGNTFIIYGLNTGTVYEWKVRTVCPAGNGSYVAGNPFTTTGTAICYIPDDTKTTGISASGATFKWLAVPGAASYSVRYRLRESISWANAISPMMLVCDSMITIPDSTGAFDITFPQGTPFTYTGNGIYLAWEFTRPGGALTLQNKALCTRKNSVIPGAGGLDSARTILCLNGNSDANSTALPVILSSSDYRPEIRLGSPALTDSLAIFAVYGLGHVAIPYGDPAKVKVVVRNFNSNPKTVTVSMTVKEKESGASRYTGTSSITVPAYCSDTAVFSGWSPQVSEKDSVIITLPAQTGENVLGNNRYGFLLDVNPYMLSYADDSYAISATGYDTAGGRILVRHTLTGCGKVISARIFLDNSATGHPLYAVMLNGAGNAVDSSEVFTPDSSEVNTYHAFFFPHTPLVTNSDFYVGLMQTADHVNGYTPVGIQWEGTVVRNKAYYGVHTGSSTLSDDVFHGRLMIRAEIIPGMPTSAIGGNLTLCQGDTAILSAASTTERYAEKVIGYSSQYNNALYKANQVLGTPDVYPETAASAGVWLSETADSRREFLVLQFPDPSPVDFINIYETFNPGSVDTVYVKNNSGNFVPVYTGTAGSSGQSAGIRHITFPRTTYNVSQVRIALNSPVIAGYNAIDAVTIGSYEDPATWSSYLWTPGGATTQSINVTSAGTYSLTVTGSGGCQGSANADVTTPITVIPTITADRPVTLCQGDSVILTSSFAEGNTWSTGATTQSIAVSTSGQYTVTVNNGCSNATSGPVTVTVNSLPVVTVTGGSICPGSSTMLDAGAGYSSYLWSTGNTTQTISVNIPGYYSVNVTDANGCPGSGSTIASLAPAPQPSISGDPYFCPGDSTLLDAGAGYTTYHWSTGASTPQVWVKSVDTISVIVTNSYGCSGTASINTGVYALPVPFISGTLSMCAGTTTVLDAGTGYAAYLWSTGETTHFIVVDTAATFTVSVTDFNGCKGSASATTTNDGAQPPTPGPITGPTTGVCNATGLVYSIAPVPNSTHYVWFVPAGVTITDGQGTTSMTVSVGSITSGVITVAASNACGQSPSWTPSNLTIYGTPANPGPITGQNSAVCGMANVPYSITPVAGATSYNWTVPAGASIMTGAGTPSVTISFSGGFNTGDICVTSVSGCGISAPSCISVTGHPQTPSAINGPVEVCKKQKDVVYFVAPVPNASSYTWTVPPLAIITSGQGTAGIMVNFGTQSGQVTVTAINSCGSSSTRVLPVTVKTCSKGELAGDSTNIPGGDNGTQTGGWTSGPSLKPEVIATAGDFFLGTNGSLSWTLGEPVIESFGEHLQLFTQGFQQAGYMVVATQEMQGDPGYRIELYPVPSTDYVNVVIHATKSPVGLRLELFDLTGKMVWKRSVETETFSEKVDLTQYPASLFMLKVTNTIDPHIRSFKIVKYR